MLMFRGGEAGRLPHKPPERGSQIKERRLKIQFRKFINVIPLKTDPWESVRLQRKSSFLFFLFRMNFRYETGFLSAHFHERI